MKPMSPKEHCDLDLRITDYLKSKGITEGADKIYAMLDEFAVSEIHRDRALFKRFPLFAWVRVINKKHKEWTEPNCHGLTKDEFIEFLQREL